MKNGSELVVLAKEIHEGILKKIEEHSAINFIMKTKIAEVCMEIIPEFYTSTKDDYGISDGINTLHIIPKEITHINKEDDIDCICYEMQCDNGDRLLLCL